MNEETIAQLKAQRLEALKQAEPPQTFWIIAGYIMAALGGILGTFIGWHLANHQKTLPTGEKVFAYSEADRRHGRYILYVSVAGFILAIYVKFFYQPGY